MLVKNWMSKKLIVVDVKDTVQDAIVRLREHEISKLPVLDGETLVGIVTNQDLRRFWPSAASNTVEIKDLIYMALNTAVELIMTKEPITVPYNYTLQETAEILLDNNISGCPVIDDRGKVLGMITRNDLFRAIISWSGTRGTGLYLGFVVEDRPSCIREITDEIRNHDGRIAGMWSSNKDSPAGFRNVSIVALDLHSGRVPQIRRQLEGKARMLYMVDRRSGKREVYAD